MRKKKSAPQTMRIGVSATSNPATTAAILGIITLGASRSAFADAGHSHSSGSPESGHGGSPGHYSSIGQAWAAIKQLLALSGELHVAADAGDAEKSAHALKKFQGAMKLLEIQYPPGALLD